MLHGSLCVCVLPVMRLLYRPFDYVAETREKSHFSFAGTFINVAYLDVIHHRHGVNSNQIENDAKEKGRAAQRMTIPPRKNAVKMSEAR